MEAQEQGRDAPDLLKNKTVKDSEDFAQRSLPNALGPEKSLLSSMLQDPVEYIGKSQEQGLTYDHF